MNLHSAPAKKYDRLEPLRFQLLLLMHDLPAVPLPQTRDPLPSHDVLALAPRPVVMVAAVLTASRRQRRRRVQPQVTVAVLHAGRGDELALVAVVDEVVLEQVMARRRARARVDEAVAPFLLLLLVKLSGARPRRVVGRSLLRHGRRLGRPPPHSVRVSDPVVALHAPEPEVVRRLQEAFLVALLEAESVAPELLLSLPRVKPAAEPRRE